MGKGRWSRRLSQGWLGAGLVIVVGLAVVVSSVGGTPAGKPVRQPARVPAVVIRPSVQAVLVSPGDGASGVDPGAVVRVEYPKVLGAGAAMPVVSPAVAGSWVRVGNYTLVYAASEPWPLGGIVSVSVPSVTGMAGSGSSTSFGVAGGSVLRLQQLLCELGYLPLTWTAASPTGGSELASTQEGSFAWRWNTVESVLAGSWQAGADNAVTKAGVMNFEAQHGLGTDGVAGPKVWAALLGDAKAGVMNSAPYDNVVVNTVGVEHAVVYRNGAVAYTSLANTGVVGAETALGTYPVYLRYTTTTMSGTNVDGSHYSDPGIPWVSYFNGGDALHGFVRASYGSPQSVGCVELPIADSAQIWPMTPIGTLVSVT